MNFWILFLKAQCGIFMLMNKGFIVVPVFNEEQVFGSWLPKLLKVSEELGAQVIVVDDGSDIYLSKEISPLWSFDYAQHLRSKHQGAVFLRHVVNLGVGAAVETGARYALDHGADWVLTIDGDGQHDPQDLKLLRRALFQGAQVVNGSRFLKKQPIPFVRRCANRLANILQWVSGSGAFSDTQSGMKGVKGDAMALLVDFPSGYAWCSVFMRRAYRASYRCDELGISVSYTLYSLSKGQCFAQGVDLLLRFVSYPFQWFFRKVS